MDDADRIPIDLGYDVATSTDASDARTTVKDDGTIVIDILVQPPCDRSGEPDEIVVCAPGAEPQPIPGADGTFDQEGFKPEVKLAPNATAKVRAETDPTTGADRAMIDFTYRF